MEFLQWEALTTIAVFGRLVDSSGTPIGGAILTGELDFMQTDTDGYFQGEIATGDVYTVRKRGEDICTLSLSPVSESTQLSRLGDVICDPTPRQQSERKP